MGQSHHPTHRLISQAIDRYIEGFGSRLCVGVTLDGDEEEVDVIVLGG